MKRFSEIKASVGRSREMKSTQSWVETFICGVRPLQEVKGNRKDRFGLKVTPLMVERESQIAEVCPFVRDSLDYDFFWLAESDLTEDHDTEIADLLRGQIQEFKNAPPAHDPLASGKPAEFPTAWKTFFTIFPRARQESRRATS